MGWSMSPYYLCSLTAAFNRHLRLRPDFAVTSQGVRRSKLSMGQRQALRSHFLGCRMLPCRMLHFLFFASSRAQAYTVRDRLTSLLGRLGLSRHPDKGQWEPVQRLEHLGMEIVSRSGRAQILFLAIKPARFYLRELHDVLRTKDSWSGRVKNTRQLRRDLEWCKL
eukprot:jgi/Tetstr1/428815/TSEL_018802.t1